MSRRKTAQSVKRGATEWIYLSRPSKTELHQLGKKFKLSDDHIKAILAPSHRSRLFDSDGYIVMILIHPIFDSESNDVMLKELDIILTKSQVVTVQRSTMPLVRDLYKEVQSSKSHKALAHPATLVCSILHALVTDVYTMLDDIAEKLDDMEQGILEKHYIIEDILTMQTNIIDIQKAVENNNIILDRLVATLSKSTASKIQTQYLDLQRHILEIQNSLRIEQITAETLHRTHETILNYKTNAQLRLLTSLSLIVLPATLLAGIFGMNVRFPIVADLPLSFWMIVGLMIGCGLTVYLIGKTRR